MYKLNTHVERVNFPGDPSGETYFLIRQGGRLAPKKRERLTEAAIAAAGVTNEEALSFEARQELTHRSACGTWAMGWSGFEGDDGRLLRCLPELGANGLPLDPSQIDEESFLATLADPLVANWLFSMVFPTFADRVLERFRTAEGESAPQPSGNGAGAVNIAN